MISAILLAFGVGGFFGNLLGGAITTRSPRLDMAFAALTIGGLTLILWGWGGSAAVAALTLAGWGVAFGAFPVGIQTWTTMAAQDQAESAGALLLTAFQVAIAGGAIFGGLLVDGFGASAAILYCGLFASLGGVLILSFGRTARSG
jgi:DHA1 family purine ribonucleoside efflux pump-like MFS transporter